MIGRLQRWSKGSELVSLKEVIAYSETFMMALLVYIYDAGNVVLLSSTVHIKS